MSKYRIKAPNGQTYEIEGPSDATQEQIEQEILRQNPEAGIAPTPEKGMWADVMKGVAGASSNLAPAAPTIEVELADGRIVEFPEGTTPEVIKATALRLQANPEIGTGPAVKKGFDIAASNLATAAPTIEQRPLQHKEVDVGQAASYAVIQTVAGMALAVALFWLLARKLWKKSRVTPHQQGYWVGCWIACFSIVQSIGKLVGELLYKKPENISWANMLFEISMLFVGYFAIGYMLGWVFRKLKPVAMLGTSVAPHIPVVTSSRDTAEVTINRASWSHVPQTQPGASGEPAVHKASYFPSDRSSSIAEPPLSASNIDDEALYEQALNELSANRKPGLWAKALAQSANGGNPDGAYIALRVEQLRADQQTQAEARNSTDLEITRREKSRIAAETIRSEPRTNITSAYEPVRKDDGHTRASIKSKVDKTLPMRATMSADERRDNFQGFLALVITFGGLVAIVTFFYVSSEFLVTAYYKTLSKDELVVKLTDRKLNYDDRASMGSKLVSSGRLFAFKATQLPYPDGALHPQGISNAIEGVQLWWRASDKTTILVLYNTTPHEINGVRLNIYSGKCNVPASPEMVVVDYKLGSTLRLGDLIAYRLDGLMEHRNIVSLTKMPNCIDVASTW